MTCQQPVGEKQTAWWRWGWLWQISSPHHNPDLWNYTKEKQSSPHLFQTANLNPSMRRFNCSKHTMNTVSNHFESKVYAVVQYNGYWNKNCVFMSQIYPFLVCRGGLFWTGSNHELIKVHGQLIHTCVVYMYLRPELVHHIVLIKGPGLSTISSIRFSTCSCWFSREKWLITSVV